MQFNKNKDTSVHQWYPFVEGYSKEFILSIIEELDYTPKCCLDPFSGSGTTSVELQNIGIKCYSFEVSPFMFELSSVKLCTDYNIKDFDKYWCILEEKIKNAPKKIEKNISFPNNRNYVEKEGLKRWHYDYPVMQGILDIKYAIYSLPDEKYIRLFKIALASILLKVSNMYRNGKCLSYKRNFEDRIKLKRKDVHKIFFERLENVFRPDIASLNTNGNSVSNASLCMHGDSKELINILENSSIDLVITSPPYLNSRDYTDSYIDELRILDYIADFEEERKYRATTLCSHVQVKWESKPPMKIPVLLDSYNQIAQHKEEFWNEGILDMISGYFWDMDKLFSGLFKKMATGGYIYFNVGNSAYYGVEIKVDEIIAEIASRNGFDVLEIREARKMPPSSQQKNNFDHLIESVIVMKKN